MNEADILIMSMADEHVFPFIRFQAETVKRHGGECKYIIWDIGLTENQVAELSEIAEVKKFKNSIYEKHIKPIRNAFFRDGGGRSIISRASLRKPFCLKACVEMGYENILYLDADAFLNKYPFKIFEINFNIGVTFKGALKSGKPKLREAPNKYRFKLLNAGVQFFKGPKEKLIPYFDEYICNYILKNPKISDQGNLNCLIDRCEKWDWSTPQGEFKLMVKNNKVRLQVLILTCERYNRFVNNGGIPPFTIIGHAKGGRKRDFEINTWQDVESWLRREGKIARKANAKK